MAKPSVRVCPACNKTSSFRSDQKTCGCVGNRILTPELSRDEQISHLRSKISSLESEISRLLDYRGLQKELASSIAMAVESINPPRRLPYESRGSGSPLAAVIKLSDWHIGEVIHADETEGFGRYDWATAQARIGALVGKFLQWIKTHRAVFSIPDLYVLCEGDFVSGDIHDELRVTNEFPLPVQAANAGVLLAESISLLSAAFPRVYIIEVGADNHGRLTRKPQAKQKSSNNMSYVVYSVANAYLRSHKNVHVTLAPGMKHLQTIASHRFLVEHGDITKAWMGIPYYGIERARGREACRRMNGERGFHYQSIGHWHVPGIVGGNVIINGSLSGTSEFDHSCGRHSEPSQVSFLVHPKYGIFDFTAWRV